MTASWGDICRRWRSRSPMRPRCRRECGSSTWAAGRAGSPWSWRRASVAATSPRSTRRRSSWRRAGSATRAPTFARAWPSSCRGRTERFDAALSSLVIAFMRDPDRGVARDGSRHPARRHRGGVHVGHRRRRDDDAADLLGRPRGRSIRGSRASGGRPGTSEGDIVSRFAAGGPERCGRVDAGGARRLRRLSRISGSRSRSWSGRPANIWTRCADEQRAQVREACRAELPDGPFSLEARAWCAVGTRRLEEG